jgi:paraquat-inducible protein B
MNKHAETSKSSEGLPKAKIKKDGVQWLLWFVPVAAAGLCVWFAYHDFISKGPTITIYFKDANGLQAQNTTLMYRGVNIGEVKDIELTRDTKKVKVKVELSSAAKNMARSESQFWIVHPDLKIGSISGLKTLVSGEYIEVRPGGGEATNEFIGEENEPIPSKPGSLLITLTSPQLDSLQEQSPIIYRGIQVGEVLSFQLDNDSRNVVIQARVWKDYAPLIYPETRFWNAGGINFHFGLIKGVQISAESPKTLITGGIEFATPPERGNPATNETSFVLNEKPDDKWKVWQSDIPLHLTKKDDSRPTETNSLPMLNSMDHKFK